MNFQHLTIGIIIFILASCREKQNEEERRESLNDTVVLSEAQRQHASIQTGPLETKTFRNPVVATGMLDVPPQNLIDVSAPFGGFIKSTSLLQGMRIKKGDVLVELQHADYIQLQQDYLNNISQLEYLEADYHRQQELAKENINAQKALQQAKAQVLGMRATVQGLQAKLKLLNIQPDKLSEKGIQNSIRLYSPINGYITEVNINLGKYVSPADVMFKIVDTHHLHAELQIFEKDITKIKEGQDVRFRLSNEMIERKAKVYLIGREITADRTVRVHCHLQEEDPQLLPGMFITGVIETTQQSMTVLPTEAIVNHLGKSYVFVPAESKNEFKLIPVKTGPQQNDYTAVEFEEALPENSQVVVKGAYTLLSLLFNLEEE